MVTASTFNLADWNAEREHFMGVSVWWTVMRAHLLKEEVDKKAEMYGLSPDLFTKPSAKKAFSRSVKDIGRRQNHRFARTISDRPGTMVVGIVAEDVQKEDEKLLYRQTTTARFDKESKSLEVVGENGEELVASYNHYQGHYTDSDIRTFIRRIVEQSIGIALRPSGGIYFIPRQYVDTMVALDSFLKDLGVGRIYFMRVPTGEGERQIAWESAELEVNARVEEILVRVEKIGKSSKCAQKQEQRLDEVKALMDCYIELTENEAQAESIRDTFKAAESVITKKIDELQVANF